MKKILSIEDNENIASAVKTLLEKEGYGVEIASSGKIGLEKAKEKFDLILLEIMLPDMSGWDLFNKLKCNDKCKFAFLSVIGISDRRLKELKEAGVSDYITKPFKIEDFVRRINKILE